MESQISTDYVLIYAAVFLSVIVFVAYLFYAGMENQESLTNKMQVAGSSKLYLDDFKLDTSGNLTVFIVNRAGDPVKIKNITVEYGKKLLYSDIEAGCTSGFLGPFEPCNAVITGLGSSTAGTSFELRLGVTYIDPQTDKKRTEFGTVSGRVELI